MKNQEIVRKFKDILENGDMVALSDFVIENGDEMINLMEAGDVYLASRPDDGEDEDE